MSQLEQGSFTPSPKCSLTALETLPNSYPPTSLLDQDPPAPFLKCLSWSRNPPSHNQPVLDLGLSHSRSENIPRWVLDPPQTPYSGSGIPTFSLSPGIWGLSEISKRGNCMSREGLLHCSTVPKLFAIED